MAPDGEVERRLAQLAERFDLPDRAILLLGRLLCLLAEDPAAPTTVTAPEVAVDVHLADSLVALELDEVRTARTVADLGAGAGFPGLALAVALPAARVRLIESVSRKGDFLRRAVEALELPNAEVVVDRAESWQAGRGAQDVVTARALAPLNVLAEYAAPLLRPRGVLVAWKGRRRADEERQGAVAAAALGLEPRPPRPVQPWVEAEERHLYVYLKVSRTPDRYPRRPGMARKRPLGAEP